MVVSSLEAANHTQQKYLSTLIAAWTGSSGSLFQSAAEEISRETLTGLLMINALADQTAKANNTMKTGDAELAATIVPVTGKKK